MFIADDNTSLKVYQSFKVDKRFKSPHKNGDGMKDMMEKKKPTLLTFLSNCQLNGKNYFTWVM